MRISPRSHAILDYPLAVLLAGSPWLLGFADEATDLRWLYIAVGALLLVQSLFTDYAGGLVPLLPFGAHVLVDVAAGFMLASSPVVLDVTPRDSVVWLPALVIGTSLLAIALFTDGGHRRAGPDPGARP